MGDVKKEIKQKSFQTPEQEAVVSLLFTSQRVRVLLEDICKKYSVTLSQFNILRILKGIYPNAHPRSEIRKRMIDKSDVTRLIDRLEVNGMVKRIGGEADKRHSLTVITTRGIKLLEKLDNDFTAAHGFLLEKLSPKEIDTLVNLLKKVGK